MLASPSLPVIFTSMLRSLRKMMQWCSGLVRKRGPAFAAGLLFAVLSFIGLNAAMEPVSRSEYCGSNCHEMNEAYRTWELSVHGSNRVGIRVECVQCHLPSKEKFFRHVAVKAYEGGKDVLMHHFGGEYDSEAVRSKALGKVPNERCQSCHADLLKQPGSMAARHVHALVAAEPDAAEHKCVKCHEHVGHDRVNKLYVR